MYMVLEKTNFIQKDVPLISTGDETLISYQQRNYSDVAWKFSPETHF